MRRRKTAIFFLILGISLIALAVALNIGWILLNLREVALMIFGIVFFALIITGLVLNTIFLLREIKRNEQQDAFLNAMTHELKTPIASIKLYLETLKTRNVQEEKKREFYDIMLADSNRLLNTVEMVLQASRTKEKNRLLNVSDIDLEVLLKETVEIVKSRHDLSEEVIKLVTPSKHIVISGDYAELQSVFINLLDNAVKYSAENPKIFVRLKNSRDDKAEIFIKDNGIGLETNEMKRIFKRFYRVANLSTQKKKGTGLGLFIVQSIIKKHGGKIRVDSEGEGKGSTFIVQLPK
ncbi:MAG: HAMP domain-containing histidine kinase [Pyrinomonadaceae bacterium]|nr:HAMP domain-containing histidine kinase [Pyrinomonadaceae bacterium]